MIGSRFFDSVAKKIWGVFGLLRRLFVKEARAEENNIDREESQIVLEEESIRRRPNVPTYVINDIEDRKRRLNERRKDFYTVKNLIQQLPKNRSRFFYFDALIDILGKAGRAEQIPIDGNIYTFRYIAKTRGKWYDLHPVSVMLGNDKGLIQGLNYHWQNAPQYQESPIRTYTSYGIQTYLYRIERHELEAVLSLDTFYPMYRP